jgi:hypothetical protein
LFSGFKAEYKFNKKKSPTLFSSWRWELFLARYSLIRFGEIIRGKDTFRVSLLGSFQEANNSII